MAEGLVYVSRTPLPNPGTAPLSAAGFRVRQHAHDSPPSRDELERELQTADAAIITATEQIDEDLLNYTSSLKVIATVAVGTDNIDVVAASKRGIVVTNTPEVLTEATADLAFGLMLATARRIPSGDAFMRRGSFEGLSLARNLGHDVNGATIGIVGMGNIGQAVARRALGFGMRILFTSRSLKPEMEELFGAEQVTVNDALRMSDFVVLTAPLTLDTHHLIDADTIALMKPTSYLINVGRGPIVDEGALVDALTHHRIAGAALDVYEFEPNLAVGLAGLENVVLTPHIGSATLETRAEMMRLCCDNVISVLTGQRAITPVDAK